MEESEMIGTCSKFGRDEKCIKVSDRNLDGRPKHR
jgi:hypothetical protein